MHDMKVYASTLTPYFQLSKNAPQPPQHIGKKAAVAGTTITGL
jgi:hypothetical protein